MTKDELYRQIRHVRTELSDAKQELKVLDEKWEVLSEFARKCGSKAESFQDTVRRRRGKLSAIAGLLNRAKAAARYSERMTELLQGRDYTSVKNTVDELMDRLDKDKRKLKRRQEEQEELIDHLRAKLRQLEAEYDACLEEEAENGE